MAVGVIMPRQGQSVESCVIGKWHKKKGDPVNIGDILFTYETDKSTFDEAAGAEGILLEVFFEEGDDVPCLTTVCVIGKEGEPTGGFDPRGAASAPAEKAEKTEAAPKTETAVKTEKTEKGENNKIKISPRARELAGRAGVDILTAAPSGPDGRIIERDVKAAIEAGRQATFAAAAGYQGRGEELSGTGLGGRVTMADLCKTPANKASEYAEYEELPHTPVRRATAKAMHASLSGMAQLTLNSSFDMTDVNALRAKLKSSREALGLPGITINDIILYAVSRVILSHPHCNAHYLDDRMLLFKDVHLAVAVDTPRGLLVPVIRRANLMSLSQLSQAAKQAATAAQSGAVSPDELRGGTITVTNLGTLGVESFTPVINPPQTCILGVNRIETRVRLENGEIKPYEAMTLSLTFDHRALDGAPAARFLKELVGALENFTALLAL